VLGYLGMAANQVGLSEYSYLGPKSFANHNYHHEHMLVMENDNLVAIHVAGALLDFEGEQQGKDPWYVILSP